MIDLVQYILREAKEKRLSKEEAAELLYKLKNGEGTGKRGFLHPMLHENTSDLSGQRFSSVFTGQEFFLKDHVIRGQRFLPGVAYLEMIREAVERSLIIDRVRIKNLVWTSPVIVGDKPFETHICLYPEDSGEIAFEVYSEAGTEGSEPVVHSQGSVVSVPADNIPVLDIDDIQSELAGEIIASESLYRLFESTGFDYGVGFRGVEKIFTGNREVLARLVLPAHLEDTLDGYVLHPSLMDSALQSAIALAGEKGKSSPFLPFALQSLEVFHRCCDHMWAYIRYSQGSKPGDEIRKLDIDICDRDGKVCVRMEGFTARRLEKDKLGTGVEDVTPNGNEEQIPGIKNLLSSEEQPGGHSKCPEVAAEQTVSRDAVWEKTLNYLKKQISSVIRMSADRIEVDAPMEKYGIDSIMSMQLVNQLEKSFGSLPKTLFFEYQNIRELTEYFIDTYSDKLPKLVGLEQNQEKAVVKPEEPSSVSRPVKQDRTGGKRGRFIPSIASSKGEPDKEAFDIAIIGVSGKYPEAEDLEEYWRNLCTGKDCIIEIPKERWNHSLFFDEDKNKRGKTYSKWGGFLKDVDRFDPLFFNISPREAEIMEPQERLFLECAYSALEDAGYTREFLGRTRGTGIGGNVGVFVGVMYEEYQLYGAQETLLGRPVALSANPASVANRVSYFCNFHGPSMAIDSMCSSSLTAVHLACRSIQQGDCELAIAGGVNTSIHPNKYLALAQGKFASSKGRCESFGQGGEGYVPGEGVGAVLLKPLSKAIADKDNIYGVIKGSSVNHGGKTNGYTVPNPNAQAELIGQAFKKAGINPRTISYIEAHGTGTSLGDPIEIAGLCKAFEEYTKDKQFCKIGSVKSNIGHCESAAGIAAITKVLLQLRNGQLVPSLHSKTLNPYIDFLNTPFIVQQELEEWRRPNVEVDGETKEYPRIAGISSFGAGGSNAHIVISEYIPEAEESQVSETVKAPAIIVLSAKDRDKLKKKAQKLLEVVRGRQILDKSLKDMAYTLQVGREAMEERLAVIVDSMNQLEEKLKDYLDGQDSIENLHQGYSDSNKDSISFFEADDLQHTVDEWLSRGRYTKLAELWVKGLDFDWNKLYGNARPCRISLPTYPFAKDRCWYPSDDLTSTFGAMGMGLPKAVEIHPLIHQNTSDFHEQRFSSTFRGEEFFLKDHRIRGEKVLPGAVHLEMVHAAVLYSAGALEEGFARIKIENMAWAKPVTVEDKPVQVHICLFPEGSGQISFEIYTKKETQNDEYQVHSQGYALLCAASEVPKLDVEALRAGCTRNILSGDSCYQMFTAMGLEYGPSHRGLKEVYVGEDCVLARVSLHMSLSDTLDRFVMHPALVDSALQASIGLFAGSGEQRIVLPFALGSLEVFDRCSADMWAYIRRCDSTKAEDKVQKLDIDLCNDAGKVCLRIKGYTSRVLEVDIKTRVSEPAYECLMFQPSLKLKDIEQKSGEIKYAEHIVILTGQDVISQKDIESRMGGARCIFIQSEEADTGDRFGECALRTFTELQGILKKRHKGKILVQLVVSNHMEHQLNLGLTGLLRTAAQENNKLVCQVILMEPGNKPDEVIEILRQNSRSPEDFQIGYRSGKRFVTEWRGMKETGEEGNILWKDNGVYLITGGAGGLGIIFAREIIRSAKEPVVILAGRSELGGEKETGLKAMEASGGRVEYKQVDVTDKNAVNNLLEGIVSEFGRLNGIIHSAGIIHDNYIIKKTEDEFLKVLSPKVNGLVNLDAASKDVSLDFFVLFSSIAGSLGNPGQADYSTGNSFMDEYALYRNKLVESKRRHGLTLSVNWPLWKEGGMHVDEKIESIMMQNGVISLKTSSGIRALYAGLAQGIGRMMVIEGDPVKIKQNLLPTAEFLTKEKQPEIISRPETVSEEKAPSEDTREKAISYFKSHVSAVIRLPVERIEADAPMEKYGIDSVMSMELISRLEENFGSLSKTLLFEYQNIRDLAGYFLEDYKEKLESILGIDQKPQLQSIEPKGYPAEVQVSGDSLRGRRRQRFAPLGRGLAEVKETGTLDIAIIGLAGRYPQASNVTEFWENLRNGRDCIGEIPKDRWDHSLYFDEERNKPGKTYSKWGGFIEGVDRFEPLFFNISPREAELIDPQERIFLECVYSAIEDAGYTRENIVSANGSGLGGNVGVFVGVMYEEYQLYGAQETIMGNPIAIPGNPASIANRVSYYCNFHGPSMAIDTMCSSSLTAIQLACQNIIQGSCEVAVAGGVNVSIHPNKYLLLAQGNFVSSKGRCESFGQGGDGYVPGEGVGAVILKPLSKAVADKDHIYGIIRGSVLNHGGKTNGYTVPNPNAQAELIKRVFRSTGINPRMVSYIEAHGTGTSLGDPIEITGLKKAFEEFTKDKQFCFIGSAKSNIGHCESAAGIAGVTKVLLQMKHEQLVPSLHSKVLNPNIDFTNTPFVVQQENEEWKRPIVEINGETRECPRIAGISSFGAGGANAHVLIEEYIPDTQEAKPEEALDAGPVIIVLSARDEEKLKERVRQLLGVIGDGSLSGTDLINTAYTLQVGREAMEERMALIVKSFGELEEKLKGFLEGCNEGIYRGQAKHYKEILAVWQDDEDLRNTLDIWIGKGKYSKLLNLWVKGLNIDWNRLYGDSKPSRISLPTYPFAGERYWITLRGRQTGKTSAAALKTDNFDDTLCDKLLEDLLNDNISIDDAASDIDNL